jgi:hypothetical protein
MQPPIFHLSQVRDEFGERAPLGTQHAVQTFQQLGVGEVFKLPEAIPMSHTAVYRAAFRALQRRAVTRSPERSRAEPETSRAQLRMPLRRRIDPLQAPCSKFERPQPNFGQATTPSKELLNIRDDAVTTVVAVNRSSSAPFVQCGFIHESWPSAQRG